MLFLVAVLLALAALFDMNGSYWGAVTAMAVAMGAENAIFERNGEVSIGVTYTTGTLVKLGQRLCEALLGGDRLSWIWYLLLWVGLVSGATLGTSLYPRWGLQGLWLAVAASLTQALLALKLMLTGEKTGSKRLRLDRGVAIATGATHCRRHTFSARRISLAPPWLEIFRHRIAMPETLPDLRTIIFMPKCIAL